MHTKRNEAVRVIHSMLLSVGVLLLATAASGQIQDRDQQECINAINRDGSKVAAAQAKENTNCVKSAGKGRLVGSAQDCLTADSRRRVAKRKQTTIGNEAKRCTIVPNIGFTSASQVNAAAEAGQRALIGDIFGDNLDEAIVDCDASRNGCICQASVIKEVDKLTTARFEEFLACTRGALKEGRDPFPFGASSPGELQNCVDDPGTAGSIAADSKLKIARKVARLGDRIVKRCDDEGVTSDVFPGDCDGLSGAELATCLDKLVGCRVCEMLNDMDGLSADCDRLDDGAANGSCAAGVLATRTPTPTPTATITPTSTSTHTPTFTPSSSPASTATPTPSATATTTPTPSPTPTSPPCTAATSAAPSLAANRAKWTAAGIDTYDLDYQRSCACPQPAAVTVLVTDGTITAVLDADTGTELEGPPTGAFGFNSVDGVFDVIANAIDACAEGIAVEYDPELGYPTSVAIDWNAVTGGDETLIQIHGFHAAVVSTFPIVLGACHFDPQCMDPSCMPSFSGVPSPETDSAWTAYFAAANVTNVEDYIAVPCGGGETQRLRVGDTINVGSGQATPLLQNVDCLVDSGLTTFEVPLIPCGEVTGPRPVMGFARIEIDAVVVAGEPKGITLHGL